VPRIVFWESLIPGKPEKGVGRGPIFAGDSEVERGWGERKN